MLYHVDDDRLARIGTEIPETPPWDQAGEYDYVVYRFLSDDPPEWACLVDPLFETGDGFHLYPTDPVAGTLPTSACDSG